MMLKATEVKQTGESFAKMNVSREADAAFMAELKRTDRERYNRLVAAIERGAYAAQRERRCVNCNLPLPPTLRADSIYCDGACQKANQRLKAA